MVSHAFRVLACILLGALWPAPSRAQSAGVPAVDARVSVYFDSDCETAVLHAIQDARQEILMAAYLLTRDDIVDALVTAARGARRVALKYDADQADYEGMEKAIRRLRRAGAKCTAVHLKPNGAVMHNKFLVIDAALVLTGSYNFTTQASTVNRENLVRLESPAVAARYREAFEALGER